MGVRPTPFTHLNIHAKVTVDGITNTIRKKLTNSSKVTDPFSSFPSSLISWSIARECSSVNHLERVVGFLLRTG